LDRVLQPLSGVNEGLRCTPVMALGVADHIWTIAELVQFPLQPSDVPSCRVQRQKRRSGWDVSLSGQRDFGGGVVNKTQSFYSIRIGTRRKTLTANAISPTSSNSKFMLKLFSGLGDAVKRRIKGAAVELGQKSVSFLCRCRLIQREAKATLGSSIWLS